MFGQPPPGAAYLGNDAIEPGRRSQRVFDDREIDPERQQAVGEPRLGRKRVGQLRGESVGSRRPEVGKGALPAGLIRAARAIVGGAKAVTRPKPVEQPTRICLSIYRGTAGTLGFAIPPVSSPWAHDVIK